MPVRFDKVTVFVARPDESGGSHEILQLRRVPGDFLGEYWSTVRGGVERGETYVAAALRELREECGLLPEELYALGTVESFYLSSDDTLWHSVTFGAIVGRKQEIKLNDEHDAYRWVRRNEMEREILWASERSVFADLCRDILDNAPAKPLLRIDLKRG